MTTVAELMAECSLKIDPLPVTLAELSVSFDAGRPKLLERLKDAGVSKLPDRQLMANTLSKAKREGRVVPSPDEVGATKLNGPEPTAPAHTGAPPGVLQTPGVIALPDGRKVSYREYGKVPDGFPILFLHGNVSSRLFEPVYEQTDAETIAAGARVIAFDRPGIGGSDPHTRRRWRTCPRSRARSACRDTRSCCSEMQRIPINGRRGCIRKVSSSRRQVAGAYADRVVVFFAVG